MMEGAAIDNKPLGPSAAKYVDPFPLQEPSSTVLVAKIKEGKADFADLSLLMPHEFVRLELNRLQQVMNFFNPDTHPWKAKRMHVWLSKYLIPAIHDVSDSFRTCNKKTAIKAKIYTKP
jgi:hypothetical protein